MSSKPRLTHICPDVVLHNPKNAKGPAVVTEKKPSSAVTVNVAKLDSPDCDAPKLISHDIAQELQTLRNQKGLTRKQLGVKLNIQEKVIISIETGKALAVPETRAATGKIKQFLNTLPNKTPN
jgi:ribosome-binding protein aMBF1 (putative translation factor)